MKYWTVQSKDVLDKILTDGMYQPDFSQSAYPRKFNHSELEKGLFEVYAHVLKAFNHINGVELPGVVFAFLQSDGEHIYSIDTVAEFVTFIMSKEYALGGYWANIDKENSVLMELEYENNFNPILVDFNDFQYIMPPLMQMPPYTEDSFLRIAEDIEYGRITPSEFPSNIIQAHLPWIKKENLLNVYPVFELGK